jgi:hypothetical protein
MKDGAAKLDPCGSDSKVGRRLSELAWLSGSCRLTPLGTNI